MKLRLAYVGLAVAAVAAFAITELSPRQSAVQRYGPNVAVDLVGVLVALFLVERLLTMQRARAQQPLRRAGADRLARHISALLDLMNNMLKASAPPGASEPATRDDLLDAWASHTPRLDFVSDPGSVSHETWFDLVYAETRRIQDEVSRALDRYAEVLGLDLVIAVEDLFADSIWTLLRNAALVPSARAKLGIPITRFLLLYSPGRQDDLKRLERRVGRVAGALEDLGGTIRNAQEGTWRWDISPKVASGRYDGDLAELGGLEYMERGDGPPPEHARSNADGQPEAHS